MVTRSCDERGDDIAVAIADRHNFVAFEVLVPAESEIVAPLVCHCCRPIAMDDSEVEVPIEGQDRHRPRENGIEAPMGFIASKGGIDPGVVNFRSPLYVLLWAVLSTGSRGTGASELKVACKESFGSGPRLAMCR